MKLHAMSGPTLVALVALTSPDPAPAVVTVAVTDAKGAALAGATVQAIRERAAPITGELWYTARAVTGEDGRAELAVDLSGGLSGDAGEAFWFYAEAPGHAPASILRSVATERLELALRPAVDLELRLVDEAGRPAAGVQLGWMLGCGHAPDARTATSDADGRLVLEAIDPETGDFWLYGEGVLADYADVRLDESGKRGTVHCIAAPSLRGRALDANGEPLVGGYVGQKNRHRGPWTRVEEDGSFVLHGIDGDGFWLRSAEGEEVLRELTPEQRASEGPVTLAF